jgi:hypothetical protein
MKKLLPVFACLLITTSAYSQKITGQLKFEQGKVYNITMQTKSIISQEAMGQAIDFGIDGVANHSFKATNTTPENTTLHHEAKRITFNFDGMGTKQSFDSEDPKDQKGPFGKPLIELLKKTYDAIIDPSGNVLMVQPEKLETVEMDDRIKIVANMLKNVLDVIQPPKKGGRSFFKVLPGTEVGIGDTWSDKYENEEGKFENTYTLSAINGLDSTIVVDVAGNASTSTKSDMMGMEIITDLKHKTTEQITLDMATGIIRTRTSTTESNGTMAAMGQSAPVTSKQTVIITVN